MFQLELLPVHVKLSRSLLFSRYLATGDSYTTICFRYRVGISSFSDCDRTLRVAIECLHATIYDSTGCKKMATDDQVLSNGVLMYLCRPRLILISLYLPKRLSPTRFQLGNAERRHAHIVA